jgi:FecR protein
MRPIKFLTGVLLLLHLAMFASVGEIKVSNGEVLVQRAGKSFKGVSGTPIEEKDAITTKAASNAQVIFSDGTAISIGASSSFNIQEYMFDEKSNNTKLKVGISEGTFKAVTGKIGKISPDRFRLETKTATIGIRGTRLLGFVIKEGQDTVACTKGIITVAPLRSLYAGMPPPEPVEVKAGEITRVSEGKVETPRKYTPAEIKELERSTGRNCNCK